jgi:hypothetical protein
MHFHFSFYSSILLLFFLQGILFSALLLKKAIVQNEKANRWLAGLYLSLQPQHCSLDAGPRRVVQPTALSGYYVLPAFAELFSSWPLYIFLHPVAAKPRQPFFKKRPASSYTWRYVHRLLYCNVCGR